MKLFKRKFPLFTLTIVFLLAADQISKAIARTNLNSDNSTALIKGILSLTLVHNKGAAFGLLQGKIQIFQIITIVLIAAILFYIFIYKPTSKLIRFALALIVAGSFGNFIDRAMFSQVTDFIDLHVWPVFNIADSSIVAGALLLMIKSLFKK